MDQAFWRSIYKLKDQSGGPVITGWITSFFPYLKDNETGQATVPVRALLDNKTANPDAMSNQNEPTTGQWAHGPTLEKFPSDLSKAPFLWKYMTESFNMEFLGGFTGVAQDESTLTLRPEIGWAVREASGGEG